DTPVAGVWLPRDSVVDLPGGGRGRLTSVYADARTGGERAGAEALAREVGSLTGVRVDHYAEVDAAGFAALSDAVGGVDLCLRQPARDPLSGVDLPSGPVTVAGEQAAAFLRQRAGLPNGDLDRVVRQQVFLEALAAKVIGAGDPALVARLAAAAASTVRTDPDLRLPEFVGRLTSTVRTAIIPLGPEVDGGAARLVDPAAVRAFAAEFFADGATGEPSGGFTVTAPASETATTAPTDRDCVR
ncbi:LCP family protein, partial [Actinosynnema sp. NPDC059335]|uniref:LCP family protein n=1 Tax=Actinosynnema sp. NPDC059335 TaxID=3346804 RepID=UPI00366B928B